MKLLYISHSTEKIITAILCLLIIFFTAAGSLHANPFFSDSDKAPPTVISGGKGFFTDIQFRYRETISSTLRNIKNGKSGTLLILIAASFLYGLLHAAGPGHRKTILFSFILSKKVSWHEPAAAGFLSAGLHAGSSLIIIIGVFLAEKMIVSLSGANTAYIYMEGITFIILALMALIFVAARSVSLFNNKENNINNIGKKGFYPGIIIASLVPCPGATMILIFALHLDLLTAGVIGIISMSIGMGVIISFAGYIAFLGREGLFLKFKHNEKLFKMFSSVLEILSFILILGFSIFMGWPFISFLLK
ncbi:MAG: hypothetical protein JW864_18335 [Spirochaetes bacterium]|nr:hypothetical protein [Spirochaetota bacterium]